MLAVETLSPMPTTCRRWRVLPPLTYEYAVTFCPLGGKTLANHSRMCHNKRALKRAVDCLVPPGPHLKGTLLK